LRIGGELVDWDRAGAGDVSCGVLGLGGHVDDDDVTCGEPFREILTADLYESFAVAKVGGQIVELLMVGGGRAARCRRRQRQARDVGFNDGRARSTAPAEIDASD
jgi:hypothetical protein